MNLYADVRDLRDELKARTREVMMLREAGDEMASEIEARWSGPGGCDCAVCSAAATWREVRS